MKDWLDSKLFDRRTLRLAGPLDEQAAAHVAAALMTMDAEGDDAVDLHLSSQSGSLDAALVLIDTIDLLGVPVRSTALGLVAGPAVFVLALSPRRQIAAHAALRLMEPELDFHGRTGDLVRAAEDTRARLATLTERLRAATGRSASEIEDYLRSGRSFTAAEAVEAGLVDEILAPTDGRSDRG